MMRSIFAKILASHIAVILVTTLTMGILMSFLIRNYVVESRRTELIQKGVGAVSLITPFLQSGGNLGTLESISELVGANAWLMDNSGRVLAGRAPERWLRRLAENPDEISTFFSGTVQSWVRTGRKQADPAIVAIIPVPNTSPPSSLFLYAPITGVTRAADAVERLLLFSLLTGMAAAIGIGFLISRNLTKPIENIIISADTFAKGNFDTRTQVTGSDEIGRLGQTFNSMAQAIAGLEQNRRDFLANVSHELKTPVASIQALAESLADGLVTDQSHKQRYLANIVAETGRIDRLLNDLLDMSQLESGELRLKVENLDLAALVTSHIDSHLHLFSGRQIRISINAQPNLPKVKADPHRLGQVLTNLLSNAARYSPDGSEIKLALTASNSRVALSVTDQGPGVPAADLPYIFDRFYRVEKSRVRSDGGTGLGLAISKKLMTAMEGHIAVSSIEGEGATFTITLPTV